MPPCATTVPDCHQYDVRREAQYLIEVVADVDHGNRQLIAQRFEVRQEFLAPFAVERGERLVEQ